MTASERRISRRARVNVPGRVETDAGERQAVEVIDISASGAQVACSYVAAGHIVPRDRSMVDAVGFTLRLAIGFDGKPPDDSAQTIKAVVAYSRRVAQDDYRFGLRFGQMEPGVLTRLMRCVDEAPAAR